MKDDSMSPEIKKGSIIYVHYTSVINPDDICLSMYKDEPIIRRIKIDDNKFILSATNKDYEDIVIEKENADFSIIGTIIL